MPVGGRKQELPQLEAAYSVSKKASHEPLAGFPDFKVGFCEPSRAKPLGKVFG